MIKNVVNGNIYIGSTVDFKKRMNTHFNFLRKNKHHNEHLNYAYNKYGESSFIYGIIQECTRENRLRIENVYLKKYKPEYNIAKDAKAPMEGRKHSAASKKKMAEWDRPKGENHYNYGGTWKEEQREKILRKRIGSKRNEETKKRMRETALRLNRHSSLKTSIEESKKSLIDTNGFYYESLTDASIKLGIAPSTICDVLMGRSKTIKKHNLSICYLNNVPEDFFTKERYHYSQKYDHIDVYLKNDNNLVGRFFSLKQLFKKLNFNCLSHINQVILGKRNNHTKYNFYVKKKDKKWYMIL
jgi:group I intron endonuclease